MVRDDRLITDLDGQLTEALAGDGHAALAFALPDVAEYDRIQTYRASRGQWARTFVELDAHEILAAYNEEHPGAHDQSQVRIAALDGDGQPVTDFNVRRCVVFEVSHKKHLYVLTLDQWYQVDADYASLVDRHVAQLPAIRTARFLPAIGAGTSEGDYNTVRSKSKRMALIDKHLVRPAGPTSTIEVCDLFSKQREFIHVKKHTRSATLSHLLAQGTVSARLFVDDRGYRQSFRTTLPASFRSLVDLDDVNPEDYAVVYAITAAANTRIPDQLPFFTKVNLLFHCREIRWTRMAPKLYHIHETS